MHAKLSGNSRKSHIIFLVIVSSEITTLCIIHFNFIIILANSGSVDAMQNGGDPVYYHSNHPFRGGKGSVWEGGHRTVAFVNGPMVETASNGAQTEG